MARFRPTHGIALVTVVLLAFVVLAFQEGDHRRVSPDRDGNVRLDVSDLDRGEVRFYRFLNAGNQEVKFFLGRDEAGHIQTGFDANEICFKRDRGYSYSDGWLTCRVCEKSFRLSEVDEDKGGCSPIALAHRLDGNTVVISEPDMLQGWRYFR